MKRYFYAFDTADSARRAFAQLRTRGVSEHDISLIVGDTAETAAHDDPSDALNDLIPRLGRGALLGAGIGFGAGLIAVLVMHLALLTGGLMLMLFVATGGILGAWVSTPIEAKVPEQAPLVLRQGSTAGRTLLVVDCNSPNRAAPPLASADVEAHLLWQCMKHTPIKASLL